MQDKKQLPPVQIPNAMYKLDSQRQVEEKKTLEMSEMKYLGVVGKQAN
jgi:hypothetical protein